MKEVTLKLEISKVTLITGGWMDLVMLTTTLPGAIWEEEKLTLRLKAAKGAGEGWIREHLGEVEIEIVHEGGKS